LNVRGRGTSPHSVFDYRGGEEQQKITINSGEVGSANVKNLGLTQEKPEERKDLGHREPTERDERREGVFKGGPHSSS